MERPMRSLIEPPGFWFSSLRNSSQGPVSVEATRTSGVLPISESTLSATCSSISANLLRGCRERSLQIGPYFFHVLDPHREPHQAVADADRFAHLPWDRGVGHQRR